MPQTNYNTSPPYGSFPCNQPEISFRNNTLSLINLAPWYIKHKTLTKLIVTIIIKAIKRREKIEEFYCCQ